MPNWGKAGYTSFDDCVSKNSDKDNPQAYCGEIRKQLECPDEAIRHPDFKRIHHEFDTYYCKGDPTCTRGDTEYYQWLNALELDEHQPYGANYERFHWANDMLTYLREDDQYKYYKVLVGFPITSMNGNVYNERDFIAAALTLKGIHPNLNHKDEWHFTPDSPWGEITTADARYEDGAVEAIIKVSKQAVCPICDGKPMTELIDSKRIVNVSLQGGCARARAGGVCDGFQFDDKGFSLLTSNVLPGIPMARIFPLEAIMVEALHSSTREKSKMKKAKKRIEMQVIEQDDEPQPRSDAERAKAHFHISDDDWAALSDEEKQAYIDQLPPRGSAEQVAHPPCGDGQIWDPRANDGQGGCIPEPPTNEPREYSSAATPDTEDQAISHADRGGTRSLKGTERENVTQTAMGTSPGVVFSREYGTIPSTAKTVPKSEDITAEDPEAQPKAGEQEPITHPPSPTPEPAGEHPEVTGGEPEPTAPMTGPVEPEHPTVPSPHDCPDGYHWDATATPPCVPDAPVVERVRRIKAEMKAKDVEQQLAKWEAYYTKLDGEHQQLRGKYHEQYNTINTLRDDLKRQRAELTEAEVMRDRMKRERDEAKGQRDDQMVRVQQLERMMTEKTTQYNKTLDHATFVSNKNTKLNEEILGLYAKIEKQDAELQKARNLGKKIVRIKV